MDPSKWSLGDKWMGFRELTSDRVDLADLDNLLIDHRWQDSSESFGEHGFAGSWRSFHEDIMSSCRSYEYGSLGILLTDYL